MSREYGNACMPTTVGWRPSIRRSIADAKGILIHAMKLRAASAILIVGLTLGACGREAASTDSWIFVSNFTARSVTIFDGRTLTRAATIALPGAPHALTVEPGGRRVWTANSDGDSASVIEVAGRRLVTTIKVCAQPVRVAFTSIADRAYVACGDGFLSTIDTSTMKVVKNEAIGFQPHDLVFGPAKHLWAVNRGSNDMSEIDPASGKLLNRFAAGPFANGLTFSPDDTYAYVTSKTWNSVVVLVMASKQILGAIKVGKDPQFVAASDDGRWIYVANGGDGSVSVINAKTFQVAWSLKEGTAPHGLAVSPDGKLLFVADQAASFVSIIDTQTRRVLKRLQPQQGPSDVALVPIAG